MSCVSPAKEWFALFVGCKLIFTSNSAVSANDVCRHFENILDTDRKLVLTSLDFSATTCFIKSRNDLQSKINRPAFLLTMPTSTNIDDSKAAKKAAAQAAIARARQRDEMRATLSPATKTPAPTAATPGPKPTTKTRLLPLQHPDPRRHPVERRLRLLLLHRMSHRVLLLRRKLQPEPTRDQLADHQPPSLLLLMSPK
jgi:hypothetical protein